MVTMGDFKLVGPTFSSSQLASSAIDWLREICLSETSLNICNVAKCFDVLNRTVAILSNLSKVSSINLFSAAKVLLQSKQFWVIVSGRKNEKEKKKWKVKKNKFVENAFHWTKTPNERERNKENNFSFSPSKVIMSSAPDSYKTSSVARDTPTRLLRM